MITIIGLLILLAAAGVVVDGVASNSGSAHSLDQDFTIFGLQLSGLSTGQLFLYGAVVGVVGMLGLSMLFGSFARQRASRASRRELADSRHETMAVRDDRDRLSQELDEQRAARQRADRSDEVRSSDPLGAGQEPVPAQAISTPDPTPPADPAQSGWSGLRHRLGHRADH